MTFDFPGDVCERCRHTLRDGVCPSCGWVLEVVTTERPPYPASDDLPLLDDYRR